MAYDVHKNSLDEDNRKFVPDEVFETIEEAQAFLDTKLAVIAGDLYDRCDDISEFAPKYVGRSDTLAANISNVYNEMDNLSNFKCFFKIDNDYVFSIIEKI